MELLSTKKIELVILLILLGLYLILATKDIALPGPSFDEAFPACGTINLLKHKDTSYLLDISLFGRRFPLMYIDYHGSLSSYILVPFFFLFGINIFSLRIASLSFGLLTLIFTYLFTKKFFNRRVAFIAILLLITSPYFIFATKIGNYGHSYSVFFSITALFCLLKWYEGQNISYFLLAMFLLGLGLSEVGWFIVFVIGVLFLALIFWRNIKKRIQTDRFKSFWLYLILGVVFFCLGDFLFLYANFINRSSRFMTFQCILNRFRNTGAGVDNLNYIKNLLSRFHNLIQILQEWDLIGMVFSSWNEGNKFSPFVFFFLLLWLIAALFFKKNMYFHKKRVAFPIILIGTMFIISPFTLSGFFSFHLFILVPFIQLIISVGAVEFVQSFKNKILQGISSGIVYLVLLLMVTFNLKILKDYYVDMKRIGGGDVWSDAIYELADWLKENNPSEIVALSWGFSRNLYFLMGGEKYIYDIHWQHTYNEDEYIKNIPRFFQDKNNRYLVNVQWPNNRGPTLFKKAVELSGKNLIEEKIFYQRDGKPVYIVYSVR